MLNREQRRKNKDGVKPEVVNALLLAEAKNAVKQTVSMYGAAVLLVLRKQLGFGPARAQKFIDEVGVLFDDIEAGRLSLADIQETIKEELSIEVKR